MNKECGIGETEILKLINNHSNLTQRKLSEMSGFSLGYVNKMITELAASGFITNTLELTPSGNAFIKENRTRNAIILAAGYGMRMVPVNMETQKAFLEVNGEPLIERMIYQLQEKGITDITIVVGYRKEQFEYLIDKYNVELVVNSEYDTKNNLHSLNLVSDRISDTYIIPCDVWCKNNPFHSFELYSWYMIKDKEDEESMVRVNRKMELVRTDQTGNAMIGIAYIKDAQAPLIRERLQAYDGKKKYRDAFWEEVLYEKDKMIPYAKLAANEDVVEINTYEQLRDIDKHSRQLDHEAIMIAKDVLNVNPTDLYNIHILKKGMTNRSFIFECKNQKYIMRIPGEGTDQLIDRKKEYAVYQKINSYHISDEVIYMNEKNGYKITKYLEGARTCDALKEQDLRKCMEKLRKFHEMELTVEHSFDLFGQIQFYEKLWNGIPSAYRDYKETKKKVFSLKDFIDKQEKKNVLTHIDAVPDNFLFYEDADGQEKICLIDWEYAGMQDPHVDIAMFCIYAMYDKKAVDHLIDIYFENHCTINVRMKIYAYISVCGLLWSNWCEYKKTLGVDFGEYSLKQYRYAKEYYKLVQAYIQEEEDE